MILASLVSRRRIPGSPLVSLSAALSRAVEFRQPWDVPRTTAPTAITSVTDVGDHCAHLVTDVAPAGIQAQEPRWHVLAAVNGCTRSASRDGSRS